MPYERVLRGWTIRNAIKSWFCWRFIYKFLIALGLWALMLYAAFAHDASSGMHYPWECCGEMDCKPVDCDSITEVQGGMMQDGLFYPSNKIRPSLDKQCHACKTTYYNNGYNPLCLFIIPST
jgi:hypothetical protein